MEINTLAGQTNDYEVKIYLHLQKYAQQHSYTLVDDSTRKALFLDTVLQIGISYSYKPVLLIAVLLFAADKDWTTKKWGKVQRNLGLLFVQLACIRLSMCSSVRCGTKKK